MQKIHVLCLACGLLFGTATVSNAQYFRYFGTCSNGQCCSVPETSVPVAPCKPVEPCVPVEPCKPVENVDTSESIQESETITEEYLPLNGDKVEVEPCQPVQETGTCEQSNKSQTIIAKRVLAYDSSSSPNESGDIPCRLLAAVNRARARFGLKPCLLDVRLESGAQNIARRNLAFGRLFHSGGATEIIAMNSFGSEDYLVQQWLNSPPHRALLLGNYRYIGVGTARSGGRIFGACQFSNRSSGKVETKTVEKGCKSGSCSTQTRSTCSSQSGSCSTNARSYSACYSSRSCSSYSARSRSCYQCRGWFISRRCCF